MFMTERALVAPSLYFTITSPDLYSDAFAPEMNANAIKSAKALTELDIFFPPNGLFEIN